MLQEMLQRLTPQEASVLAMRWGLADGDPKTLGEVGKRYGVTRERIRAIERRALEHLRQEVGDSPLLVVDSGQIVGFVDVRRSGYGPSSTGPGGDLVLCPQCEQRRFLPESGQVSGGRHRKYCSNACRQAAYRARRGAGDEEPPGARQ
jgi:hypothetical protein